MNIAIVLSEFNEEISNNLLEGAMACSTKAAIDVYRVPGAFEIPSTVKQLLEKRGFDSNLNRNVNFDAIVTLGCVIKGETAHFEYISSSVTDSISKISIETNIPIIYGILTVYDYKQALERSDPSKKNKGGEVMQTAIDTIKIYRRIRN